MDTHTIISITSLVVMIVYGIILGLLKLQWSKVITQDICLGNMKGCFEKRQEGHNEIIQKLNDAINRITIMEQKFEPFWESLMETARMMLKHPTEDKKDELLDRFPHLTKDEVDELELMLRNDKEHGLKEKSFRAIAASLWLTKIDMLRKGIK